MSGTTIDTFHGAADMRAYLLKLQSDFIKSLEKFSGDQFQIDAWQRMPEAPSSNNTSGSLSKSLLGDGKSCVVEQGNFFERAGINFSHVKGQQLPPTATAHRTDVAGQAFEAMGVSLVLHPRSPYCPTVHFNIRLFSTSNAEGTPVYWFGGGMDLTPYYAFDEDCRHFHTACKAALDPYGQDLYPRFKTAADNYFYLKHRQETRGIGGIFYDDFSELGWEKSFALTQSVGDAFLDAYLPIVQKRQMMPYGERERDFQAFRRGRYVEFNLVFDRGTLFGLQSGGRTESILMSLPPVVKWGYNWQPEPGTPEHKLYTDYLIPRDWV